MAENTTQRLARFLFEGSMLKRTWRTGYAFLGQGRESVAAHTFGVMLCAFVLGRRAGGVDMERLLTMCLVHDLPEARIGDANAVHKRYVVRQEEKAVADMVKSLPDGEYISALIEEFNGGETREAILARDADQLDMLISLKEHLDTGSPDAAIWIPYVRQRLRTREAHALADRILNEHWASWWMSELLGEDYWDKGP